MIDADITLAIAERSRHFAGLGKLPPPAAQHPAIRAAAALALVADPGMEHELVPHSITPQLTFRGCSAVNELAAALLELFAQYAAMPAYGRRVQIPLQDWLEGCDF